MKPAAFAYAKARSLDDAIRLLGEHQGEAKLLAGGQSLIATLNMRLSSPSLLVDINGIAGLDGIVVKNGMVEIGAMTRHVTLERSSDIAKFAPLIAARDAADRTSGDPQSRHDRRLACLCGSGRGTAGLPGGAGRRDRHRRAPAASAA